MHFKGTAHRYGRDIDTDVIIPARYLNSSEPEWLAQHCLEDLDADFVKKVKKGDIIVAEENFGCGSSREHGTDRHQGGGCGCGHREELRTHLLSQLDQHRPRYHECPEAVDAIKQGDVVDVDADVGVITNTTTGETFKAQPFPPFIREIIEEGGLINRTKKVLGK